MIFCWMLLVCLLIHYNGTVMPVNQYDKISSKSQINNLSTRKYDNIHLKSKTEMRKLQESSGKLQEERKPVTEINRVYSQIMPITRAKNNQNMANNKKERKQNAKYNLIDPMVNKEKSSESGIASQKENKLLKPKIKREAEYFLSISKREVKSKTNKRSTLVLEESTLESKYDLTTVENILITKAYSNLYYVPQIQGILGVSQKEIWFVSDEGSDRDNCQTESTPCKNLQTVLDRASDGAEIYITSETLSLDLVNDTAWYKMSFWRTYTMLGSCCLINSSLSYTLRSVNGTKTNIICSSKYFAIKPI